MASRKFSVVVHDVPAAAKDLALAVLQKLAKKYVIALEPYNHQDGYHLQMFYELKSPSPKSRQLDKWQSFKWGRVQVDPMRGNFDQASVYVISPDKDKKCDPSPYVFPNKNSGVCQCTSGHYWYDIDKRSFENFQKRTSDQVSLLYQVPCTIEDYDKWEEECDYLRACTHRALEVLCRHRICQKCLQVRAFFRA